ncbi:MAG: M23 family metallopeptidase [Ignavibacteriales bacterium]|nr:M23 family metallopeptidase [Ignavibacteriales bacterium]
MKLKKIKRFSIIVVPEETSSEPHTMKISSLKLMTYISIYSVVIFLLGFYIISFTPLSEVLFPYSLRLTDSDKKKVEILNDKVNFLANEIESLKSVNKRLKFAIMLGDSTLLKEPLQIKDSTTKKNLLDGNILNVFKDFIYQITKNQNQEMYFITPAEGFLSRSFNPTKGHNGNDYSMKENSPIFASSGGYVVFADYVTNYGYTIIINHPENYITKYLHCSSLLKKDGDFVRQGELIALSGNSGTESTGPHLHFEIWKDGKPIDPEKVLIKF